MKRVVPPSDQTPNPSIFCANLVVAWIAFVLWLPIMSLTTESGTLPGVAKRLSVNR